jgi:hypothetical protein
MKNVILFLILIFNSVSYSQELVKNINLEIDNKTEYFHTVDDQNNKISLFLINKTDVESLLFDENINQEGSLKTVKPDKKFKTIIGNGFEDGNAVIYWLNPKDNEVLVQTFYFGNKNVSTKILKLEISEEEEIIKNIMINNTFYIITVNKYSSILNFHSIKNNALEKKTIDLSDKKFINKDNRFSTLWAVLYESFALDKELTFQNISNETPPSLVISSNKRKAYVKNNTLIFTLDNNKSFTQIISIDLKQYTASVSSLSQPYVKQNDFVFVDSNSFIVNEQIIQMKLNSDIMIVEIKDFDGKLLKQFEITDEKDFEYKNSDIIQENGSVKNTRILGKTNQLLRKTIRFYPSLSCYSSNNKLYLTIGGVSLEENKNSYIIYGGLIGGASGGLIGGIIAASFSNNNLNSYRNRKIIYINSVFDQNFNHIPGQIEKLPFDELRAFAEDKKDLEKATVFKLKSDLYFSAYDSKNKSYSFFKFKS